MVVGRSTFSIAHLRTFDLFIFNGLDMYQPFKEVTSVKHTEDEKWYK